MTLLDLQKVLGDRIAIHNDLAMDSEERKKENETSDIISRLAKQMINNADVILRTDKLIAEGKLQHSSITKIIGIKEEDVEELKEWLNGESLHRWNEWFYKTA